jgi:feruloyl esterase
MRIHDQWPLLLALSAITLCSCREAAAEADPCASLTKLALPNTTIASAETVAAGAFRPPSVRQGSVERFSAFSRLPSFCRLQAIVAPSSDSHITVEVWLPTSGWNG